MSRSTRKTSQAAKTAKSTARVAASKARKSAKKVSNRAGKTVGGAVSRKAGYTLKKQSAVSKPKAAAQHRPPQPQKERHLTPVEQAAQQGLTYHGAAGGMLIADDADVQRIAKAITKHRKDLMKNLAR